MECNHRGGYSSDMDGSEAAKSEEAKGQRSWRKDRNEQNMWSGLLFFREIS